ncbi:TPA: DUF1073 domain-containing protein, partial [Salmonella enterica]|nr:DUF1073 domain-containing protein [Salmonella enterica]
MFERWKKKKAEPPKEEAKQPMSLANALAMMNEQERIKSEGEVLRKIERYTPPPGVIPEHIGDAALA